MARALTVLSQQTLEDVDHLAHALPHRTACTNSERQAADYIAQRFRDHAPEVSVQPLAAVESILQLFAAYYGEFFFVALIATWFPRAAFVYGLAVFTAYLAEFSGYRILGRLLPQFESQNVVARFPASDDRPLVVVASAYDSPLESPFNHLKRSYSLRMLHGAVVAAMACVISSCALQANDVSLTLGVRLDLAVRWLAALFLGGVALYLLYCEHKAADTAADRASASGAVALLALAARLQRSPIKGAEVCLAATGCGEIWSSGLRHLLAERGARQRPAVLINLGAVNAPILTYSTVEGMMYGFRPSRHLREAAARAAAVGDVSPAQNRGWPTGATFALSHGVDALTVSAPPKAAGPASTPFEELDGISLAVDYTEALLRALAEPAAPPAN